MVVILTVLLMCLFFFIVTDFILYLCKMKSGNRSIAGRPVLREESPGSVESPYFLTGRDEVPKGLITDSATEKIPLILLRQKVRVKTRGKSSRRWQ